MDNENVWHFAEKLSLCNVDFLVTSSASKVLNRLTFNDFAYTCVQVLCILHFYRESICGV